MKMETIEEQSQLKCEISLVAMPSRVCLVGQVAEDVATLAAAKSFDMPIVVSKTGLDIINDGGWRTFFILPEFEGATFEAVHKAKHCILGPPALRYTAEMKYTLGHNTRPIYNYSMRGVVTCFTGIRKKDELTKLVNLIHSMGGCIKKDLNTKTTHLICNHSGGEKYQYAKTFRLTVVRPAWVYAAWAQRDTQAFNAVAEAFSKDHKLKAFEGQKICFFGFPAEEQQHMVEVLIENGGVSAELDDPECSHVVMPNTGAFFTRSTNSTNPNTTNPCKSITNPNQANRSAVGMEVDGDATVAMAVDVVNELVCKLVDVVNKENALSANNTAAGSNVDHADDKDDDDDDDDDALGVHFDERLVVVDYVGENDNNDMDLSDLDEEFVVMPKQEPLQGTTEHGSAASTPKSSKYKQIASDDAFSSAELNVPQIEMDGIVLSQDGRCNGFQETANGAISPILKVAAASVVVHTAANHAKSHPKMCNDMQLDAAAAAAAALALDTLGDGDDDDIVGCYNHELMCDLKRKRDSFDSISLMSAESFAQPTSSKKPKLIRTGSLKRTIKRSMSFVAERTPIFKTLRTRRSSIAAADASTYLASEADDSICSLASVNTTLNESIRRPVKDRFRSICARVTRSASKKDKQLFDESLGMLKPPDEQQEEEQQQQQQLDEEKCVDGFKTPKAPFNKFALSTAFGGNNSGSSKGPKSAKRLFANASFCSTSANASAIVPNALIAINHVTNNNSSNIATASLPCDNADAARTDNATSATTVPPLLHNQVALLRQHQQQPQPNNAAASMQTQKQTVVDEHMTVAKPEPRNHHTHILKSDWFWYTIQNGFANEMDYLFGDYLDSIANTPNTDRRDSLPISFNKRKRKRLSQRLQFEGTPLGSGKRRSSVSDAGLLSSVSNSFFDCTASPDKLEAEKLHAEPELPEPTPGKKSMRFNHFMDFYTTESNYVGILDTILNLFKNKLEELAETNDALLNKSEIKSIFGNFLPIHEVHQSMLEHLRTLFSNWREDCLIGDIIIQHRNELIKAYPPYVNFYEQMKEQLLECDQEYPRFHAFLKINQTKPECGRQSLQDLMIRPVQRLPSISLLLNDILKHTNNANPDHARLEEALKAIKSVTMHINEDKRRTESRMAIFDIFNDIDGCPAHLVSSNRSFISKCEVNELSDCLSGRGDSLLLYLFSDSIEVCKKRSRGFNTAKSPSTTKTHKHVKLVSLNTIRIVIDIADSPRAFALLQRGEKEKLYTFSIADEETDKMVYLKKLCLQMAEHACRTDADKMLVSRTSQELEVDISDVNLSTLSKAFKLAAKTRLKVGRAFSFNKTPNKLKRAVSTMMTSPFGSTNSLTPATQLAQMRLASCTNIHEVDDEDGASMRSNTSSTESAVLIPPLSVQPTRKNKALVGRI